MQPGFAIGATDRRFFDREIWRGMASQGWLGIPVSEEHGGMGLGLDAAGIVARVLGNACSPEPYVAAGLVAPVVLERCPSGDLRNEILPRVVAGELISCLAWQDVSGNYEFGPGAVQARDSGDGIVLSGEVRFVPVAEADAFAVVAANDDGPLLAWVARGSEGLDVETELLADGSASARLRFADATLPANGCLARGQIATEILAEAIDWGVIANCSQIIGCMERALELTLEYLKTRTQFGQPIGAFQVLQHRSVDLWVQLQLAQHTTAAAIAIAAAPDVTATGRALAASSAKARVGEVARLMCNETVQLHGAIGFTDEYDLGLYVNRMLSLAPYMGNASEHRQRYGNLRQNAGEQA